MALEPKILARVQRKTSAIEWRAGKGAVETRDAGSMKRWSKRLSRLRGVRRGGSVVGLAGHKEWLEDVGELMENDGVFRTISVARLCEVLDDEDLGPRELFMTQDGITVRVVEEKNDKQVVVTDNLGRSTQTMIKARLDAKPRDAWTLRDVRDFVVRDEIVGTESFTDVSSDLDSGCVADSFVGTLVIHAGAEVTVFRDLLDALLEHFHGQDLDSAFVWIDIFAEPADCDWTGDADIGLIKDMQQVAPRFEEVVLHIPTQRAQKPSSLSKRGGESLPTAFASGPGAEKEGEEASNEGVGLEVVMHCPFALWQMYCAVQQKATFAVAFASHEAQDAFVAQELSTPTRITAQFSALASEALLHAANELVPGGANTVDEAAGRPIEDWLMRSADETIRVLRINAYGIKSGRSLQEKDANQDHGQDQQDVDDDEDDGNPKKNFASRDIVDASAAAQLAELLETCGAVLLRRGAVDEATRYLEEALSLREKMDGAEAMTSVSAAIGLGRCQAAAGKLRKAQITLEDALANLDADADPGLRGRALLALGLVLHRSNALDEALGRLMQALQTLDPEDIQERTERTEVVLAIAAVLNELARPEEAIFVFDQALDAVRATDGLSSLEGARAFCAVVTQKAEVLRGQGLHTDALGTLEDAIAEVQTSSASVPGLVDLYSAAAETLERLGYFSEAQERYTEAVRLTLAVDPVNRQALGLLTRLGRLLASTGQSSLALEKLGAAHELALKHFGKGSLELADVRVILGSVLLAMGDHERAGRELRAALAMLKRLRGHGSLEVGEVLDALASVSLAQGETARARDYLENAHGVFAEVLGPDDVRVANLAARIQDLEAA
ncbi:Hypothetical Protein FCC1311_033262 [Hondaea fermentalgiana]|uniref:Nephrocystin-3 n=1 Tax=Hondaea fermentalgiana TaxID=2315210 RepID=A0A2R5GEQ8_9STRA|nr:Hypothetical Protein FCC1311_033262 [Hondaea fermentalgiana]|eukprot:GBG27103.1 Hypothetical Protein FCC1311_033262 [Hondaea fermentalgiana]